jgi:acetyl-CoA synthetase
VIAAEHPDRTGLRIVGDDGSDVSLSFGSLSARSAQLANWLRGLGVRRGDRVLLMLGNVAPLWEVILAVMKLGAVIIPASTLLQPADLADRLVRGSVRHVVADAASAAKFEGLAGDWTRIVVDGPGVPGWHSYSDAFASSASFTPDGVTRADDPLLLYFTSGTTAQPKLVAHTQASYPVGHLSTMYWIGIQPGDVHLNLSSPGWAKHACSSIRHTVGGAQNVVTWHEPSAASNPAAENRAWFSTRMVAPAFHGAYTLLQACLAQPGEDRFRCTSPGWMPTQYMVDRCPTG